MKKYSYLSLHIGINRVNPDVYGGWDGLLNACENDAVSFYQIMPEGTKRTLLLTEQATRSAFRQSIDELVDAANIAIKDGLTPVVFFSYSGHGGWIPSIAGDESKDSTFCFVDGMLRDNEINHYFAMLPNCTQVVAVIDACHSGGGYKAPMTVDPKIKGAPNFVCSLMKAGDTLSYPFEKVTCAVAWLAGAPEDGYSYDGEENGTWTAALLDVIFNSRARRTSTIARKASKLVPNFQDPTIHFLNRKTSAKRFKFPFNRDLIDEELDYTNVQIDLD